MNITKINDFRIEKVIQNQIFLQFSPGYVHLCDDKIDPNPSVNSDPFIESIFPTPETISLRYALPASFIHNKGRAILFEIPQIFEIIFRHFCG